MKPTEPPMSCDELTTIGRALLPEHSQDRWRKEVARLTGYSDRMVRYWEQEPEKYPVPLAVQKVLRAEYQKRSKRGAKENAQK